MGLHKGPRTVSIYGVYGIYTGDCIYEGTIRQIARHFNVNLATIVDIIKYKRPYKKLYVINLKMTYDYYGDKSVRVSKAKSSS